MTRAEPLTLPPQRTLPAFTPPPRFEGTRFETYEPQHPSQEAALEAVRAFVAEGAAAPSSFRWPWQKRSQPQGRGLYLDGGFGVGKTHLLASAYHASAEVEKAYLSFQELVYVIGVQGTARAKGELGRYKLLCIDEFELDDPGNALIVKTFLAHLFSQGGSVLTTSNTPPEAQGQGRFNADDFKREIQSLAERFEVVPIGGPDYRRRGHLAALLSESELSSRLATESAPEPKVRLEWEELLALLTEHHPIRYRDLMEPFGTLYVSGVETIGTQNDALRFVHFIDKLYDLKKGFRAAGEVSLEDLFHPSYRESAYAKKHHRCLSRLTELLEEDLGAR